MEIYIGEIIVDEELDIGDIELDVVKEFPELENLEVTPSVEEQNFKSSQYGYDNVKVKAVESEEITITPSTEDQVKEGMYKKVTVVGDSNLVANNIQEGTSIFGVKGILSLTTFNDYIICNNLASLILGETPLIDDPNVNITLDIDNNENMRVENNTLIIEEVAK